MKKNFFKNLLSLTVIFSTIFISQVFPENWYTSSGNYKSFKYSELDQINKKNIKNLNIAWIFKNGFIPDKNIYFRYNNQATPVFTGNLTTSNYFPIFNPEIIMYTN